MVGLDLGLHPEETWYIDTLAFMELVSLDVFLGILSERILTECCLNVEEIDFLWDFIRLEVIKDAYIYVLLEDR